MEITIIVPDEVIQYLNSGSVGILPDGGIDYNSEDADTLQQCIVCGLVYKDPNRMNLSFLTKIGKQVLNQN